MSTFLEDDREIVVDFVNESNESIEQTEQVLLKLEDMLGQNELIDPDLIDKIFRTFHSIKGSAGFIGLNLTNTLTHHAETLLDMIRKDKLEMKKEHIDVFLEVCDNLQMLLDQIQESFTEDGYEDKVLDLESRLNAMCNQTGSRGESETIAEGKTAAEKQEMLKPATKPKRADSKLAEEALITPEMIQQFVVESQELLDSLEQDLLALEQSPQNKELIESSFRSLHSLKGNAGLFGYSDINVLSHRAETFLDQVRQDLVIASSKQFSIILELLDFFRAAIANLAEGKPPLIPGKVGLLDLMDEVLLVEIEADKTKELEEKDVKILSSDNSKCNPEQVKLNQSATESDYEESSKRGEDQISDRIQDKTQNYPTNRVKHEVIRVGIDKLNKLMNLVGEIVIAESMVAQKFNITDLESAGSENSLEYLQKNVRELQDLATSMRMIPLSSLFSKMRRLVRDLSAKKNNQVELHIEGGETEVDRSVIEHISDPLVHILRNSIDHGIEMPAERKRCGKPPVGRIQLAAKRAGGEIWIVIEDDGNGLNKQKILKKARDKGLVPDNTADLSDQKIYEMIFQPGFSTAVQVTNLSGRGVGMDVVSRNIQKIRGRVDIQSQEGTGTSIFLKIPLTTAIVDGMLIRIDDSTYAIPTLDIQESLQVDEKHVTDLMDGQEVIKVRDQLLPVLRLQELHDLGGDNKALGEGIIVVTQSGGSGVGIFVHEIIGQQQLVIKALPEYIGKLDGVSGCAVLGNGDICLILDLASLVKIAESRQKNVYMLEEV